MNIEAIRLLTNDLESTFDFYHNTLGLTVAEHTDQCITFSAGKTKLTFIHSDTYQHPIYHFAFTIPANKLSEAFDFIQSRTTIMDTPSGGKIANFSNWNAEAFYFYDNNGNILEFITRYDLKNSIEETFSGASIQAISEIGLVTDHVTQLAKEMMFRYNIPVFEHQPALEQFTALGDNFGLFILAVTERTWYPTQIKAGIFPVTIHMQNQSGECFKIDYPSE
jgi:catechol-2,3-dioxygenase